MVVVPHLGRWWWIPSTTVFLALLVLLVVPAVIDHRLIAMRESLTTGEHARTALNDFEASFATELLLRRSTGISQMPRTPETSLDDDLIELRSALGQMDGGGIAHADSLNRLLSLWRSSLDDGAGASADHGLRLIAAAEKLDTALTNYVVARREAVTKLSGYFVAIPAILGPLAVVAMVLSMWSGRQVRRFAEIADREREQVVRAGESRAALLRGVTHDVKNPLGAADGYAQLLEDGIVGPLQPTQQDMVRRIRHLLGLSIATVADLLELARADGSLHLEYASADLLAITREIIDDHRGMARDRDISLDVAGEPAPIVTDPTRVGQILANLISNAIKYSPRGGRVRASIVRGTVGGASRVGVAVEDDGPGIPRELEPRLFEEFFRVNNASNDAGNGLGLAISRRIGRLLGGDVTYARRDAAGSVFTAWFPDTPGS